ncbi:hypothetical protein L873DRAFT_1668066 [Choiromyces venosus 120613-1]|uniref:Integral membrane protein n=1 Tax=Choiromyces venosus 120613-1 TaxID=1336337 RepID=A0A3N4K4C3_9PEZI|nr:hypothetical protein L873DRAFT_1668066 [Choiromyces venosus 120613-1]
MADVNDTGDAKVASFAAGFSVGFGFLTAWSAVKQTRKQRQPWKSVFVWMVWGELIVCTGIGIQAYLLLNGLVPFNFWVFQVQLLMQIIINRCAVVMFDKRKAARIKWATACVMTLINISVFIIWIPAHQPNTAPIWAQVNEVWDRMEKIIILLIDGTLNWYFVRVVKQRLVSQGLTKYNRLVKFNVRIIMVSLAMDAVIIGTMSLKNGAVYIQLHPLAYIVKLNIELSMASLITKVARDGNMGQEFELSSGGGTRAGNDPVTKSRNSATLVVHTQKEIIVDSHSIEDDEGRTGTGSDSDDRPLHHGQPWQGQMGSSATASAV